MSHTVIEMVKSVSERLEKADVSFGHGTTCAWDEAAWLVLWALLFPLGALNNVANLTVSQQQETAIETLLAQRIASRKPLAYLTHEAWLQGVSFYVDERTIVPRSLIAELLTDGSVQGWVGIDCRRVLDLCTGNGSLAILAATFFSHLIEIDASDLSADALQVAAINLERHNMSRRVRLVQSDGLSKIRSRYDLILCNPPYVNANSMALLPAEYLAEPRLALAGGMNGMELIQKLVPELPARLSKRGIFLLEVGYERTHFEQTFPGLETVWLETSAGPNTVLILTREALLNWNRRRHPQAA